MSRRPTLDPHVLARIRDLRLLAHLAVDGFLHGAHPSRRHGAGSEFSHYRAYEPGDDPRRIDWKLYARSDRVFVRQAESESQLSLWLVVDASASMAQPSGQIDNWTRLDCAKAIAASLGYLAHRQGDAVGVLGLGNRSLTHVPDRCGSQHFDAVLHALEALECAEGWPSATQLDGVWGPLDRPGLVVLISDFFQLDDEVEAFCTKLRAAGKEVLTVQLLTRDELDFPWRGGVEFVDRETGAVVQLDAGAARSGYRQRLDGELARLDRVLAGLGVYAQRAVIEQPLDEVLATFLERRRRGALAGARGNV